MNKRPPVLFVDGSIGFGGSTKSLGLLLRDLPEIEKLMATSQDRELVEEWFPGLSAWPYRSWVNYRSRNLFQERLAKLTHLAPLRRAGTLAEAGVDLLTEKVNRNRLRRLVGKHAVELVHLNNGFTIDGMEAARLSGVPCIVHQRGFYSRLGKRDADEIRNVAHVIAVSQAVADSIPSELVPEERVTAIHDPVDIAEIDRAAAFRKPIRELLGIGEDEIVAGIFGRVIRWKGQLEFVKAGILAMEKHPRLRMMIIGDEGDGSRSYLGEVREIAARSTVSDRFIFAGYQKEVEKYYAAVDVVVHASISPEPFGMVVPEGMAAGCPVIAADAGGPREVVAQGMDGFLVPPGGVEPMADAMLELARNRDRRVEMGLNARAKAHERFRIETHSARVMKVFAQVLGEHRFGDKVDRPKVIAPQPDHPVAAPTRATR